jgi:hypothetical protein
VPYGTDPTLLVATFTASSKATVRVGNSVQVSGVTANNFTNVITYIVTAENGITKQYTVQVIIAPKPKSTEKEILTFGLLSPKKTATISDTNISLLVPFGTDVTKLIAEFTVSSLAKVTIQQVEQVSGVTSNDFTNPVVYTVTAEDGSTKEYLVKIEIEKNTASLQQLTDQVISVYPNPVQSVAFLSAKLPIDEVTITDIQGGIVYQIKELDSIATKHSIDVSTWSEGCYFVHVFTVQEVRTFKIEVQK